MHRRNFLCNSASCGAHVLSLAMFAPSAMRNIFAIQEKDDDKKVVAQEKWGRLEKVHEGVWALISTPFGKNGDFTTVCNGGIVQGETGVLVVEAFMQKKGAKWMAEHAKTLTGKWPTDIISTHYHADHSGGHLGFFPDDLAEKMQPRMWLTQATKDAAEKSFTARKMENNNFKNVQLVDAKNGATIDLGGRKVKVVPRSGHTSSDVTVEVVDPKIVFSGDLFFNRMFPNYVDAIPSRLNEYVNSLGDDDKETIYVPGHGPIADAAAVKKYKEFLSWVETQAKTAHKEKVEIEKASADFKLDEQFNDWLVWSPQNVKRAFAAWYRELDAAEK